MSKKNKSNSVPAVTEASQSQPKLANSQRDNARNGDDLFQPHNAKKEGLGPNTKR